MAVAEQRYRGKQDEDKGSDADRKQDRHYAVTTSSPFQMPDLICSVVSATVNGPEA